MTREERISNFLETWNEAMTMVTEMKEQDNFKFQISVAVTTSDDDALDRVKLVEGINQSFRDRGWRYSTDI